MGFDTALYTLPFGLAVADVVSHVMMADLQNLTRGHDYGTIPLQRETRAANRHLSIFHTSISKFFKKDKTVSQEMMHGWVGGEASVAQVQQPQIAPLLRPAPACSLGVTEHPWSITTLELNTCTELQLFNLPQIGIRLFDTKHVDSSCWIRGIGKSLSMCNRAKYVFPLFSWLQQWMRCS